MFDVHTHILPGIDDGADSIETALQMARIWVEQGVQVVAATPHILPGVYCNAGPSIRSAMARLQVCLNDAGVALLLVTGADNHFAPKFVAGLAEGRLLALNDTRYVLVEPPHHVAPPRLGTVFMELQVAGYVPVLTHPERLSWIGDRYDEICELRHRGVLMQVTAASLTGSFGATPRYWAERMLGEGLVDILASDAHDVARRPPNLAEGHARAQILVGRAEADNLVIHRPRAVLENVELNLLPSNASDAAPREYRYVPRCDAVSGSSAGSLVGRLRRLIG
jgi:protein-tyrosine phosphatase